MDGAAVEITAAVEVKAAVREFLAHLEVRHFSRSTLHTRRWALDAFARHAAANNVTDVRSVSEELLSRYLVHMKTAASRRGTPYSAGALGAVSAALSTFFRFLAREGVILFDPARDLTGFRRAEMTAPVLTEHETELVLSKPDTDTPEGLRDRTMLELLYCSAVRRAELVNLTVADVRTDTGTLFVRQGKGGKDRVTPVGERALFWLKRYLAESRPRYPRNPETEDMLFLMRDGRRIIPQRLTKTAARYVRSAGIEKGSCHIFRHTCATGMIANGADIVHVQEMLGHADVQTSVIYAHVSGKLAREVYGKTHPAAFAGVEERPDVKKAAGTASWHGGGGFVRRPKKERLPDTETARAVRRYLEARTPELSAASLSSFLRYLGEFSFWCAERGVFSPAEMTRALLAGYQKHLARRRSRPPGVHGGRKLLSVKTQKMHLETVAAFTRWCVKSGLVLSDPGAGIVIPRAPVTLAAQYLTKEELERVFAVPDERYPAGMRDTAVLWLLYASGMRRGELLALRVRDVDEYRGTVRITALKQGKDRSVPLAAQCVKKIGRYLADVRPAFVAAAGEDCGALFLSSSGRPLSEGTLVSFCARYFNLAGVAKKCGPHIFRHTCAVHMIENGADLRTVQEILGHRSMNSTRIYAQLSIKKLKEVHAKTHPGELRFLAKIRRGAADAGAAEGETA